MENKPILYAEDEADDAFLLTRAFRKAGVASPLQVVSDGQEAMDFLAGIGKFMERSLPSLILLDLNMPRKSGFDVLRWVRRESSIYTLPVIILTSSSHDHDLHTAYRLGANAYLVKPGSAEQLVEMVRTLKDFWLTQNQSPPDCANFKAN